MTAAPSGVRYALDIGGTFTDLAVLADGRVTVTAKVLTTHADPLAAVAGALAGAPPGSNGGELALLHATTLVANAIIERRGSPVTLVTTEGFADTLLIGDEGRFDMYDLELRFPDPLVAAGDVIEIGERTSAAGDILVGVSREAVAAVAGRLRGSVAVAFLHSYANPANERHFAEVLRELRPDLPVTLSSDVAREVGEYARTSTAVANAFVKPVVTPYLEHLERLAWERLDRRARVLMMLSAGGLTPLATAAALPIRIVESGPAAGVTAAHAFLARRLEAGRHEQAVTLDMGGTTAKVAFLDPGQEMPLRATLEVAREDRLKSGSGLPLLVPSVDLIEIGAGGGSIAHRSELGLLEVGPQSAGSEPGPAAYGRGGSEPTVTDANVVLGYVPPWQRLGGVTKVDAAAARRAFEGLATSLSIDIVSTALAVHDLADEHMAAAIRVAGAERGEGVEDRVLVAFGGAAPLHACGVARRVGIRRVLIPLHAGVFSALGLATAPLAYEAVRPWRASIPLQANEAATVERLFSEMRAEIGAAVGEGLQLSAVVEMRFRGQNLAIDVPVPIADDGVPDPRSLRETFFAEYERVFDRRPAALVEAIAWRLRGTGGRPDVEVGDAGTALAPLPSVLAVFTPGAGPREVPVVARRGPAAGAGPALIVEDHTTTVVPPGWRWAVTADGVVELEVDDD